MNAVVPDNRKVFFELEQDESGYPPVAAESLWARPTEAPLEYVLDNIPFFARVATLGDRIRVEEIEGRLWYRSTLARTTSSLIRVVGMRNASPTEVGAELQRMGCKWERDDAHLLIAVNVPQDALQSVQLLLADRAAAGDVDYEEAILR